MTNEEAIYTLANFKRYISGGGVIDKQANEALNIAIEALKYKADEEQFWSEQYQDIDDYPDTDGDAIRYLDGLRSEITDTGSYEYEYLTMAIEALSCSESPNRSDTIYRQDAIDAIHCNITVTGRRNAELVSETIATFADRIKALPSAQPERKKGEWRDYEDGSPVAVEYDMVAKECYCDQCGSQLIGSGGVHVYGNFCPYCGADMRGEQNGQIHH